MRQFSCSRSLESGWAIADWLVGEHTVVCFQKRPATRRVFFRVLIIISEQPSFGRGRFSLLVVFPVSSTSAANVSLVSRRRVSHLEEDAALHALPSAHGRHFRCGARQHAVRMLVAAWWPKCGPICPSVGVAGPSSFSSPRACAMRRLEVPSSLLYLLAGWGCLSSKCH